MLEEKPEDGVQKEEDGLQRADDGEQKQEATRKAPGLRPGGMEVKSAGYGFAIPALQVRDYKSQRRSVTDCKSVTSRYKKTNQRHLKFY